MNSQTIGGIALLVVGAALVMVGIKASNSVADRFSEFFTGHFTDATVWYLVGGVASAVAGLAMPTVGGGRALLR